MVVKIKIMGYDNGFILQKKQWSFTTAQKKWNKTSINGKAEDFKSKLEKYKKDLDDRTNEYATSEIEKFEAWSDDRLVPLQNEVIELRKEKDAIHRNSVRSVIQRLSCS